MSDIFAFRAIFKTKHLTPLCLVLINVVWIKRYNVLGVSKVFSLYKDQESQLPAQILRQNKGKVSTH